MLAQFSVAPENVRELKILTKGFVMFSRGMEMKHWAKMC